MMPMISRSAAWSTSVTKSLRPLGETASDSRRFKLRTMPSPARRAARAAAARTGRESRRAPAAVVFGAERTGLTNEELESAHALVRIPASAAYPSLNLAMAVQLVAYELFRAGSSEALAVAPAGPPLAGAEEMARLYAHFAQVLEEIEFRDRTQSGTHLMERIRRFLQRAELDQNEVNILRGILTAVQSRRRHAGEGRP